MVAWSVEPFSQRIRAERMDRHQVREMPMREGQRIILRHQQLAALRIDSQFRHLRQHPPPVVRFIRLAEDLGQLGRSLEGPADQSQIVIRDRREPRRQAVVVDLGRGTERQRPLAVRALLRHRLQEDRCIPQPRIRPLLQELPVHAVAPLEIEMMAEPGGRRGGMGVLVPAADLVLLQVRSSSARSVRADRRTAVSSPGRSPSSAQSHATYPDAPSSRLPL